MRDLWRLPVLAYLDSLRSLGFDIHWVTEVSADQVCDDSLSIRVRSERFRRLLEIGQVLSAHCVRLFGEPAQNTLRFFFLDFIIARPVSFSNLQVIAVDETIEAH